MPKTILTKDILVPLVVEGLNDVEIAEKLKVTPIGVYSARIRLGIIVPSRAIAESLPLTVKQKEFMTGCLLGDGSTRIDKGCINPRFTCEHSEAQIEYARFKFNILKGLKPKIRENISRLDKRTKKVHSSTVIRLNANPELLTFHNKFYTPTKEITLESLEYYSPFAVAIHYMDDGSLSSSGYYIATNSFSVKSVENLQYIFKERYNINTSIHSGNILYIKSESKDLFTKLIQNYVIPTMRYKLHNIKCVS